MALCVWGGFKKGLIGGIVSLAAIIISLIVANILATQYSNQLVPALNPFVGGFIDSDSNEKQILEKLGYGETDLSLHDILEQDSSLKYDYAYECIRSIGFYRDISEDLASDTIMVAEANNVSITDAAIAVVCNTLSYVGCLSIAFIMVLILINAVLDMINLDFHLPNIDVVDEVSGAALGLIKGFLYCVLICWVLGFSGMIIGKNTCDSSAMISFFQAFRFITSSLI